ncbi:hypothetical protein ACTWP4_16960 [Gracilibacillus sp. D59]|uniref:hypothetical protein n=1 Tax=Gracilibacillus sp. D59 TaxID=3457434 RepID=UPI003FCE722B
MKWLIIALSVVTVTVWGIVLFFYLDLGQKTYIYADQHAIVHHKTDHKQANFIFRSKRTPEPNGFLTQNKDSSKDNSEPEEPEQTEESLANLTHNLSDNNTVSIDELMAALDIEYE